jgi:hypothetical protein
MTLHLRLLHLFAADGQDAETPPGSTLEKASAGDAWLGHLDPLREDSGVDLVCVTGRAAGPGAAARLPCTTRFLAAMLDRLGLGRERLFLVPTAGPLAVLPADGRLADPGCVGCRRELRIPRLPFGVQVISFDPAWLGGGTAGTSRPWLTAAAVDHLACGPLGEPLPGLRVGLLHQPLTDLDIVPATARRLADRVDLLLSGGARALESAGGTAWLAGGAPPGQPPIGWQIITVTCDPEGRPCRIIARLRATTQTAGWRSPGGRPAAPASLRAVPALRRLATVATAEDRFGAAAEPEPFAPRVRPSPPVRPSARMLGEGIAEDCARAAALACRADRLLAEGRADEALHIYREQLLPLHQALASLPSRGFLVHRIAAALERRADLRHE